MITQSQKTEKSAPQSSATIKDALFMNILPLQDGKDKPAIVSVDIGIEKDSSFLVILIDGMYIYEPL